MDKKRILFIGVGFHEYDAHIINFLEKEYDVSYIWSSEYMQKHPYLFKISQLIPSLFPDPNDKAIARIINKTKTYDFDIIFVIKGSNLTNNHLSCLKKYHPHAKFILYVWDTWSVMKNRDLLIKYFPTIFSFDSEDCKKYGFRFRPLFYIEQQANTEKKYDISFVGGEHSGRFDNIALLKKLCIDNGLRYRFVVKMMLSVFVEYLLHKKNFLKNRDIITISSISYKEYLTIIRNSRAVIDIQYSMQSGLTIRTLEALASGAKVITTNKHILDYPEIPTNMYMVWDGVTSDKLISFIKTPTDVFSLDNMFSIESFLDTIFHDR